MNLDQYKEETFKERPDVKEAYDALGDEYKKIENDLKSKPIPKRNIFKLRGLKFYRFFKGEDKPVILRLKRIDEISQKYILVNCETKELVMKSFKELHNEWIKLNPDGLISFDCCTAIDNTGEEVPDVMVRLHKITNGHIDVEPYAVCRQSVIDIFALLQSGNRFIAGMSINKDTCPPEVGFNGCYAFNRMSYSTQIAVYLDDHIDDILCLFNHKKFNDRLHLIKMRDKTGIKGFSETLEDLLKDNYFMFDFHMAYEVHELDFDKFNFEDPATNRVLTDYIITNTNEVPVKLYPVKYSKYIDLKDVQRRYILITSNSAKYPNADIILLAYDVSETISFKTLVNNGKNPKQAKREIMAKLGWS